MPPRFLLILTITLWPLASALSQAPDSTPPPAPNAERRESTPPRELGPRGPSLSSRKPYPHSGPSEKLLRLLEAPPERLDALLDQWPKTKEMSPEQRQKLKERVLKARDEVERQALAMAKRNGVNVPTERKDDFLASYAKERREMEETLRKEFEPRRKQLETEMSTRLREKFGTAPIPENANELDDEQFPPHPPPRPPKHKPQAPAPL